MASDISALDPSFPLSQLRVVFTGMIPGETGEPSLLLKPLRRASASLLGASAAAGGTWRAADRLRQMHARTATVAETASETVLWCGDYVSVASPPPRLV